MSTYATSLMELSKDAVVVEALLLKDRIGDLERKVDFYQKRVELLQSVQHNMRDPERTIACDIIANGELLPDSTGKRYGEGFNVRPLPARR